MLHLAKQHFYSMPRHDLEGYCLALGVPIVHAKSLFRKAYKNMDYSPWESAKAIPRRLQAAMAESFALTDLEVKEEHHSKYDQSVKFVVALADGAKVETVLMPESQRLTLCVSTQVGCAQRCVFCHTGRMGLQRNLTSAEIVGQLMVAQRFACANPLWLESVGHVPGTRISNIVFMGMGEPLDNVVEVVRAIDIFTDPYGLALGLSHISVSTAGHLDGLKELLERIPKARIALSVHDPDEERRSRIMPINRRWPLGDVIQFLRDRIGPNGQPVLFQYTMIKGVNDSPEDARKLLALTQGLNAKINLIPMNDVGPSRLEAPTPDTIQSFRDLLHAGGVRVMVRYSKGQDIAAACGQLVQPLNN